MTSVDLKFGLNFKKLILEKKSMSGWPILPYLLPFDYAVDIDDINSFRKAEEVMSRLDCVKF